MKPVKNSKELEKQLEGCHSGVAGDTIVSAKAVVFIAKQLEKMVIKLDVYSELLKHERRLQFLEKKMEKLKGI